MKKLIAPYQRYANRAVQPIRHPLARILVALLCLMLGGSLIVKLVSLWFSNPVYHWQPIVILALLLLGACLSFYLIYLLLFAPFWRQRLGILPPLALRLVGAVLIVQGGVWMLRGIWEAALLIAVGSACFGLASERKALRDKQDRW